MRGEEAGRGGGDFDGGKQPTGIHLDDDEPASTNNEYGITSGM